MSSLTQIPGVAFGFAVLAWAAAVFAADTEELYAPPSSDVLRLRTLEWIAQRGIRDNTVQQEVARLWADEPAEVSARELFEKVIRTFALADVDTQRFLDACRLLDPPPLPPDPAVLFRNDADEFYAANMRLFYARYLAQRRMYDEALDVFTQLDPHQVVDPATCLFFKAVCQQQLFLKDEALKTIDTLLRNTEDVPVSYSRVATLMQYELEGLRAKSLNGLARMMADVERRLDLGRGGQTVQKKEDEVVALLDEIIEKLEQQSSGGGGSDSGQGRGANQSNAPANDSRILGQTAPGEVDEKNFKNEAGWGALPPKDEARAKNLLNRNFPAHYRRAVEEYFKKLARRRAER